MFDEKKLKDSFSKIKEDMLYLQQEITILRQEIKEIRNFLESSIPQTNVRHSAHSSADNFKNQGLNRPNFHSSIGNEGVPADRQQTVSRQFDTLKRVFQIKDNEQDNSNIIKLNLEKSQSNQLKQPKTNLSTHEISLLIDNLRQDLKDKFKTLTKQEFLVFSVLYTLEEELDIVTYKDLANRTGLTESSCRDYISRLQHKGLPIVKEKVNNKIIVLRIPRELKDIATLDSLSKLKTL